MNVRSAMHWIQVSDGISGAYEIVGQGEPLLLIPGTGQSGKLWSLQVPAYSLRYQCIVLDNRGVGDSPDTPLPL